MPETEFLPAHPARGSSGYTPYSITPQSIGWLIGGASQGAAPRFLEALRRLPPQPGGRGVAGWAAAVFSRNAGRAQHFAARYQLPFHGNDLEGLLARPDIQALYVANLPQDHAATVRAGLRAGRHVLCEAPLALTMDEALYLQAFAADRGLVLAVNFQQRFDPAFVALRSLLVNDDLGDLVAIHIHQVQALPVSQETWRTLPASSGLLLERALRTIDVARFLSSDEIVETVAWSGPSVHGKDVVDDLHAMLRLRRSRAIIHMHDSWTTGRAAPRIEVYGTLGNATISEWSSDHTSRLFVEQAGQRTRLSQQGARSPAEPIPLPEIELWPISLSTVHEAIGNGTVPSIPALEAITALSVALALRSSLAVGAATTPSLSP